MNVVAGERYKVVSDEVIQYALGLWGEEEKESIDPDVRDRILSRPRAKELARWQPPQFSLRELRRQHGGAGVSDDDLLLRYFAGEDHVAEMRAQGSLNAPTDRGQSLARLTSLVSVLDELTKRTKSYYVHVQKSGAVSLKLERKRQQAIS